MKDLSIAAVEAMNNLEESVTVGENTKSILNNTFEGKEVRTFSYQNEVCFVAKDVAELLDYKDTPKAIKQHCRKAISLGDISKGGDMSPLKEALNLGNSWKQTKIIKQSDVLRLIVKSTLPNAEKIEEWIFDTVIPKVLDTGSYEVNNKKDKEIARLKDLLITQNEQKALVRILLTNANAKRLVENPTKYIIVKSHLRETLSYDERVQLLEKKRVTEREELEAQSKASFKEFRDLKVIEWKKIHYNYSLQMQDLLNISFHEYNSSALIRRYEMVLEDEFLHNKQVIIDEVGNKKKALEEELNAQIEQLNNDIDAELKLEKQGMDEVDFLVNAINQGIIKIENQPSTEITEF
jgi:prophage antirepressor-like protein/ribosomal protein S17E